MESSRATLLSWSSPFSIELQLYRFTMAAIVAEVGTQTLQRDRAFYVAGAFETYHLKVVTFAIFWTTKGLVFVKNAFQRVV